MTEFMTDAQLYEMPPSRMRELLAAEAAIQPYREALQIINDIRDTIVGTQSIGWSRDIYPLVAALNAAGLEGRGHEAAKAWMEAGRPFTKLDPYAIGSRSQGIPGERELRAASERAALHPEEAP